MNLAGISIKQPVFVTMLMLVIVVVGFLGYSQLPVNQFPDTTNPSVSVSTDWPGAGPQEVAEQVTQPLEAAVSSLAGVTDIRSTSREGTSDININFTLETDPKIAFQTVSERISRAQGRLPTGASQSTVSRFDTSSQPILSVAVSDPKGNLKSFQLRNLVINEIQPRLERIDGVGQVSVGGGQDREIDVNLNLDDLRTHRVSPAQVVTAITAENVSIPGGTITTGNQDLSLRMPVQFTSLEDIANLNVNGTRGGQSVRIKDIGTVVDATAPIVSYSRLNGKDSVQIQIQKQSGTNTVAIAQAVKGEIARVKRDYRDLSIVIANDQSDFIQKSIVDSVSDLITGAIFASLVVLLFFGGLRLTLITSAVFGALSAGTFAVMTPLGLPVTYIIFVLFAELLVLLFFLQRNTFVTIAGMPVIMIGSFAILNAFGLSLNMMTLLALSLAVGLVLDDAIVVRENIFRHMERGAHPKEAAREGTNEVSLSVIAMSLTIVSVFLPIAFTTGQIGRFYREFGIAVTAAVVISLFEAFTLAPMLSAYLFKEKKHAPGHEKEETVEKIGWFDRLYRAMLAWTLNHKLITTGVGVAAIVAVYMLATLQQISLFPRLDNGNFQVGLQLPPGTTLAVTNAQAQKIEAALVSIDGVDNVFSNVGGGSQPERANFNVQLKDFNALRNVETQVRKKLAGIQGLSFNFQGGFGGGGTNVGNRPIQVNLLSTGSIDELNQAALDLGDAMSKVDGVADVANSMVPGKPELQITADRTKASVYGLTSTSVGSSIRTLISGASAGTYKDPGKDASIVVRLRPEDRARIDDILNLTLTTSGGQVVPLRNLATVSNGSGPSVVTRLNRQTQVVVGANLAPGASQAQVVKAVTPILATMKLPAGVTYRFGGQIQQTADAFSTLVFSLILSLIFMYIVLASQFGSFTQPIVLMLALPFAFLGAFAALLLTHIGADMTAVIGMMLLMGLAVKNSILLVDFTNRLRAQGMSRKEALLAAGPVRLRPVIMTTLALILGMLPVSLGLGAGGSFRAPMAIAVIGGLVTSTILTLLFVPVAYTLLDMLIVGVKSARVPAPVARAGAAVQGAFSAIPIGAAFQGLRRALGSIPVPAPVAKWYQGMQAKFAPEAIEVGNVEEQAATTGR